MRIDTYLAAASLEETQAVSRRKREEDSASGSGKGDTVSFSDEALALLEQARTQAQQASSTGGDKNQNGQNSDAQSQGGSSQGFGATMGEQAKAGGATEGGSGESDSETDPVTEIDAKIKQLSTQLAQVAQSDMPENSKQSMMGALNSQISELVSQKQQLQAEAAKAAAAKGAAA